MTRRVRIAPSILSADLGRLGEEIAEVERHGADWIHVDVVDGHFAPFLTFGPKVVEGARSATQLPLDVHLMVDQPERYLEAFAAAGADTLTVHGEGTPQLGQALQTIRGLGKRAGIAFRPETSLSALDEVLPLVDLVLILSVNPGRSGQSFIESQLEKIASARQRIEASGRAIDLEVDGGVHAGNAKQIVDAGANVLVAGSQIFGRPDREAAIRALRVG